MKKLVILISLIFIFLTFLLFLLKNMDSQTNNYLNKEEVLENTAIQRGWIPDILPDSAYKIVETHNIDTNKLNGSFKYLEKDEEIFLDNLKSQESRLVWGNFEFKVDKANNRVKFFNLSSEN
ncbi:hypothetical protein ACLHDG_10645 [Sulfurovum sp. CS9]|uniref:hypothetical protein n=1 Tax=Sulfurovum sp. CS9 TaxID=3391146 RepID=UPI0039EA2B5F